MAEYKKNYFMVINGRFAGESAPSVAYGPSEEVIINDLKLGLGFLKKNNLDDLTELENIEELSINPVSKAAVLASGLNYISEMKQKFPWEILNIPPPQEIRTSFTVSIDQPDKMIQEIKSSQYPLIKIKMGSQNDFELVELLKDISGKRFRIDANGGWDAETAEQMLYSLRKFDVDLIEQPTSIEYVKDWKYIRAKSEILFIMDEGLNSVEDYEKYSDYIDGVNIKMAKSGGILQALKIAKMAKKDRLRVMLGCMVETSVGIAPSVYLSSFADFFDLDGPLLIKENIASGIDFNLDKISVDEDIIGGPRIRPEYLKNNEIYY